MDTDGYGYSFIVHVNTDNIYQDITKDVKARFEFYIRQTIAMRKKLKKVIGLMENELVGLIMK